MVLEMTFLIFHDSLIISYASHGRFYPGLHSCLRGGHRNLTNQIFFWPQGLPTPLNISTIMVIHLALPSTMCNLALPESGLNVVEIYSIRFSTKIEPQFWTHIHPYSQPSGIWGFRISHRLSFEPKFSPSQAVPCEIAPTQLWNFSTSNRHFWGKFEFLNFQSKI